MLHPSPLLCMVNLFHALCMCGNHLSSYSSSSLSCIHEHTSHILYRLTDPFFFCRHNRKHINDPFFICILTPIPPFLVPFSTSDHFFLFGLGSFFRFMSHSLQPPSISFT
ncbi:hypothetical protein K457DRAFT_648530 [Linnemannia elongata AG-77]|uniref:Secreted protein n=1 Tax=Linnemannia elongata AG-77 TaxID=1314771 RepID=A0A197KD43_9FUNG|nr:hypothetical protein K457DRAFT_648530 [Linnemannia elongata AG-77]